MLTIKRRLLLSHLFAALLVATALGSCLYYFAAQQMLESLRMQLISSAILISENLDPALLETLSANSVTSIEQRVMLTARLKKFARSSDLAQVYVISRTGHSVRWIAASDNSQDHPTIETATLQSGFEQPTFISNGSRDQRRLIALVPVPGSVGRYAIGVEMRAQQVDQKLQLLHISALIAFPVCVLIALLLSRHLAGRFQSTVRDLVDRCRALAAGQPLPPANYRRRDDLDDVAYEFDSMARRLRDSAESRERAYAALRQANQNLESRVRERTHELESANLKLKAEIENRVHIEALLAHAAMTDTLTGLLNRRAMMEMLAQAMLNTRSNKSELSVIIADIDYFKNINDSHGHDVGDQVLKAVASTLETFQVEHRHTARWGGEEFLLLCPGLPLMTACKHAEELRQRINKLCIGEHRISVSLSFGVAEYRHSEELDVCLRRADQALYRAKDAGRNTVIAAQATSFVAVP